MGAENHYLNVDEMTPYHKEKIAELRGRVSDLLARYPEYDTDFSMLRWLMGWDYKIDEIVPKMKFTIETVVALGCNDLHAENEHQINTYIRSLSQAAEYFPGGHMGRDKDGNVVYMQCLALTHPKTLAKAGSVSELFRLTVIETELAFKLVRESEKKNGNKLGVKIVIDLDQFSMDLVYTPTLKIYLALLTLLQDIYPDFARKIYIVNAPVMINAVYAMISPVLSKQTREKVNFLGSNWKEVLVNDLGAENIYERWGGNKKWDLPSGDLRMGGKVPEKLWYNPESNAFDEKNSMTKLSVGARSRGEVRVQGQAGKELRFLWRVSSGDVDFSIEFDGLPVYPKMRLSTEFVPEMCRIKCEKTGEYVFYFDNSHGKLFGKDIKYRIELV